MALAVLFLVTGLWAAYRRRIHQFEQRQAMKLAYSRRAMESEMKALRAQMNPHFLFNSLNSIKQYIIQHDARSAADYLTKFARLMRQILNNSRHSTVSLSDEMAALELYLQLEQMRFPGKFEYRIEVSENLRGESIQVPPLLFQPYEENAIWHGLMRLGKPGLLTVSAIRQNGNLEVSISDNGIGRERAAAMQKSRTSTRKSMGMQLAADRLRLINLGQESTASVQVDDLKNTDGSAAGTRVWLRIPVNLE